MGSVGHQGHQELLIDVGYHNGSVTNRGQSIGAGCMGLQLSPPPRFTGLVAWCGSSGLQDRASEMLRVEIPKIRHGKLGVESVDALEKS